MKNKKSGFTLIELLVVISIIALLSSVIFASLNNARIKARDAQRMSDMSQIRNALELYKNDYGLYPVVNPGSGIAISTTEVGEGVYWSVLQSALHPYISTLPRDPINHELNGIASCWSKGAYFYNYTSFDSGKRYSLFASLEIPRSNTDFLDPDAPICPGYTQQTNMYNTMNGGFGVASR